METTWTSPPSPKPRAEPDPAPRQLDQGAAFPEWGAAPVRVRVPPSGPAPGMEAQVGGQASHRPASPRGRHRRQDSDPGIRLRRPIQQICPRLGRLSRCGPSRPTLSPRAARGRGRSASRPPAPTPTAHPTGARALPPGTPLDPPGPRRPDRNRSLGRPLRPTSTDQPRRRPHRVGLAGRSPSARATEALALGWRRRDRQSAARSGVAPGPALRRAPTPNNP